jgi:hypothetical protein
MSTLFRCLPNYLQFVRYLVAVSFVTTFLGAGIAHAEDIPSFKKGNWEYDSTLVINGKENKKKFSKCTDPTNEISGALTPMDMGICKSSGVKKAGNKYSISTDCGKNSSSQVVITTQGDSDYTEVDDSQFGNSHTKETTVAHRTGECKK